MSIKRYTSEKDNTITSAYKVNLRNRGTDANLGSSDILELFSIYGQASSSSLEQSRVLMQFSSEKLLEDRTAGIIPESGSVTFKLKLFNAEHGQTTPEKTTFVVHPVAKPWNEGGGLDMEGFMDVGTSSWLKATSNTSWENEGGDILTSDYISTAPVPISYTQYLDKGTENLDIDITPIIEEFLKTEAGGTTAATGSIQFNSQNPPEEGDKFKIYSYNGDYNIFEFVTQSTATTGNTHYVEVGQTAVQSVAALLDSINVLSKIGDSLTATSADAGLTINLTQGSASFYGNTIISSSAESSRATVTNFGGGTGALNYGLLIKLSGSLEDGSASTSYYTKKFFSRSSHHYLERPVLEAQWDASIKDDRASVTKSSPLATDDENVNNIYFYNKRRTGLMDIPNTGSNLVVKLVPSPGSSSVDISGANTSNNYITASKVSTGIYKASFVYGGDETSLHDIWQKHDLTPAVSGVAASASVNFTGIPLDSETFTLTDSTNTTASFVVVGGVSTNDGSQDENGNFIVGRSALADIPAFVTRLSEVITAQTTIAISSIPNQSTLQLTQDNESSAGNTTIDLSSFTGAALSEGTGFQGGVTAVAEINTYTDFFTGSAFSVEEDTVHSHYEIPHYLTSITNLKSSYSHGEDATFRVYTRNKNWKPNIYTVAKSSAPVNTIKEGYYKISRVIDNFTVIDYSTGSSPSYSSLSYDVSGSYFDLDMSILEPNYLYEISFLYKDGTDYIEQKEKFKFRVDP